MLSLKYYLLQLTRKFEATFLTREALWGYIGGEGGTERSRELRPLWRSRTEAHFLQVVAPERVPTDNFRKMMDAPLIFLIRGKALTFLFGKARRELGLGVHLKNIFGASFPVGPVQRTIDAVLYIVMGSLVSQGRVDVGLSYTIQNVLQPSVPAPSSAPIPAPFDDQEMPQTAAQGQTDEHKNEHTGATDVQADPLHEDTSGVDVDDEEIDAEEGLGSYP
uniref:Uncharacterized protein n=1 Tax=Chromera velia CCMP2878 TaxID=1169474 RepID=A0A0G4HIX7_9ALVE|eukprot:Cvel_28093.t1-p1 / transcript=Cvel_28093.t1 / gene=Cvel_28093 / organism=Chromera_velia_CCMP2878 / gene_product=hypothetical protein / transcript_product=hypothetical protein / location=Cvel_scaffold3616:2683-3855(-) / protein_length=219 / sequence_SO=supercontig / SO=protein_coding / is_pseudo=false